jgi:hypothetical protein
MPERTRPPKAAGPPSGAYVVADTGDQTTEGCSIDEMIARYPGEWIVMRVTEYDERHLPARGALIAHTSSRREAQRIWGDEIPRSKPGDGRLYLFDAYPRITTGEELRKSLAELAAQPDPVPWPGLR